MDFDCLLNGTFYGVELGDMALNLNKEKCHVVTEKELAPRLSDSKVIMEDMRASGGDCPEKIGQPVCQYYIKTGICKFGVSCKFHHPSQGGGSSMPTALNIYGYPLRSGEKECSYYVKTGQCKFGVTCKFHHPQPASLQVVAPVPGPAPVSPAASASTQLNVGASLVYGVTQLSLQAPAYTGRYVLLSSFPAPPGSSPMPDYFAALPQEVFSDILIRLPLKSVGRSRCVSKPWLSLLTSYEFTKAHLAHHTYLAQEQKLLLFNEGSRIFSLTQHLGGNHLRELEFFDKEVFFFVGSCDGLVATRGRGMWLINCLTEEYVMLPVSPFLLCRHLCFTKYGFGYDELSEDYKFIKVSQCDYGQFGKSQPNCPEIFVDIYSLKTGSWKRLETSLHGHDLLNHSSCVFINGAFHWIGLKFAYSPMQYAIIGAFDLSRETFTEFPAPASVNDRFNYLRAKLVVIDGCLGIVPDPYVDRKSEIWLMKSYSSVESWMKIIVDFRPLCFHQDRILFHDWRPQALYCLKDGRVDVCLADTRAFDVGMTYSESLVSPRFINLN